MAWPPELSDLKEDLGDEYSSGVDKDDTRLQQNLDAAVAFVHRVHEGGFDFAGDPESELPDPPEDMFLGTIRLAGRWYTRRRSPDGLVDMAEMGAGRVPSFDPDIDRMLRIGKYRGPVFA